MAYSSKTDAPSHWAPLNEVLTDTHLSNLYSYPCKVTASNNRYTLK
jgi:hypothetical protein